MKPTITYIKENEEKTIILNLLNKEKSLKDILQIFIQWHSNYRELIYKINENITFIYFKDCKFIDLEEIETPEHTLCIFENCTFIKKENILCGNLSFIGGSFELINPIFKGIKNISTNDNNVTLKENKKVSIKRSLTKNPS